MDQQVNIEDSLIDSSNVEQCGVSPCEPNPCLNGGECSLDPSLHSQFTCTCLPEYQYVFSF